MVYGKALFRPDGDEIAAHYGPYKSKREISKIKVGDKLDMLCPDGLNYHVDVKEISEDGTCRLHFRQWSAKYDYVGPIENLYLADQGKYSDGISTQNTYPEFAKQEAARRQKEKVASRSSSGGGKDYYSETRYPEDFLSKPRLYKSRKRSSNEGGENDGDPPQPQKRRGSSAESVSSNEGEDHTSDEATNGKITALPKHNLLSHIHGSNDKKRDKMNGESSQIKQPQQPSVKPEPSSSTQPKSEAEATAEAGVETITTDNKHAPAAALPASAPASLSASEAKSSSSTTNSTYLRQQQLGLLQDALRINSAIKDTIKAIDIVEKHAELLDKVEERSVDTTSAGGNGSKVGEGDGVNGKVKKSKKPRYTANQLLELLGARKNIDEVIEQVLKSMCAP